jgi:hypothetical protein
MKTKQTTKQESSGTKCEKPRKKAAKSAKNKPYSPKIREQMVAEAAYFRSLNRNFQGDYCEEDWLEAESEIDSLIDDGSLEEYEDLIEADEEFNNTQYCG